MTRKKSHRVPKTQPGGTTASAVEPGAGSKPDTTADDAVIETSADAAVGTLASTRNNSAAGY